MCGLFGFIGTRMDIGLVSTLATLAETRGPHAYGFAWLGHDGQPHTFTSPGQITHNKRALLSIVDVPAFIGHCRLSTSGPPQNNTNNQPLLMGDIALAHNGNVYAYQQRYALHNYVPKTSNDSEAMLLEIFSGFGTLRERARSAWTVVGPYTPLAALVLSPSGIAALRRYHPLYALTTPAGVYLCSRQFASATLLEEDVVHFWDKETLTV